MFLIVIFVNGSDDIMLSHLFLDVIYRMDWMVDWWLIQLFYLTTSHFCTSLEVSSLECTSLVAKHK